MDEKLHWLWLSSLKGFGSVTMLKYLRAFDTVTELYDAGRRRHRVRQRLAARRNCAEKPLVARSRERGGIRKATKSLKKRG